MSYSVVLREDYPKSRHIKDGVWFAKDAAVLLPALTPGMRADNWLILEEMPDAAASGGQEKEEERIPSSASLPDEPAPQPAQRISKGKR